MDSEEQPVRQWLRQVQRPWGRARSVPLPPVEASVAGAVRGGASAEALIRTRSLRVPGLSVRTWACLPGAVKPTRAFWGATRGSWRSWEQDWEVAAPQGARDVTLFSNPSPCHRATPLPLQVSCSSLVPGEGWRVQPAAGGCAVFSVLSPRRFSQPCLLLREVGTSHQLQGLLL